MKRTVAVLAVMLGLMLAGCSAIDHGTIIAKVAEPGNYYTTLVCSYWGKYGCTVWVPIQNYDDPDWRFDIHEGDKDGFVYVTEETFDKYEVGDNY